MRACERLRKSATLLGLCGAITFASGSADVLAQRSPSLRTARRWRQAKRAHAARSDSVVEVARVPKHKRWGGGSESEKEGNYSQSGVSQHTP